MDVSIQTSLLVSIKLKNKYILPGREGAELGISKAHTGINLETRKFSTCGQVTTTIKSDVEERELTA